MPAPLDGITILDFTRLLPGPFATQLLCNLGAEVIKVEDPNLGDYMRAVPPLVKDVSYPFLMVNRGKKSLAVDLKTAEGRGILQRIVRRADVVVEQFRPGVMARLGADYDSLAMMNPKLVYCSFSGYGQTGPDRDLPGHDLNFEAKAGLLAVPESRDARPFIPAAPIADLASGFNAALSILAALRARDRTGHGEFLDVSIFDTAVGLMVLGLARFLATGEEPVPGETLLTGTFPFYALYETKDHRWLAVAAVEPKFWKRLCELIDAPELVEHQFAEDAMRATVAETLATRLHEKTMEEWEALFVREGLPVNGVKRVSEVVHDQQLKARDLLPVVDVEGLWKLQVTAHPARYSDSEVRTPSRVPRRGEHTEEILRSLGFTPRQIDAMEKQGVIAS